MIERVEDKLSNSKFGRRGLAMSPTELSPFSKPGPLTEMDRFIFECFGYLLIEDVLSSVECQAVLAAATRLHAGHPKDHLMQLGRGFETEPSIERLIDHRRYCQSSRASRDCFV